MASDKTIINDLVSFDRFTQAELAPLALIDVRDEKDFRFGHLDGAANFPVKQLVKRIYQLPDNTRPLRLCGTHAQLEIAFQQLSAKGYQVKAALVWCCDVEKQLMIRNQLRTGNESPRLWAPAKIVEHFLKEHAVIQAGIEQSSQRALDIACGAGRDSVYLALNGWQVSSIDYLEDALKKAQALAENHQVSLTCYQWDIEKSLEMFQNWDKTFELVLVVRYLHRPLLPLLKEKISPGGFLVYQTFMQGCEKFGSPKNPRFLLTETELAELFSEFNILIDRVEILADGRPTKVFVAQKRT